tara:strand:- start:1073 stop:5353 length:4281 start_codon:yes stop_codon:yes gene_type:complete
MNSNHQNAGMNQDLSPINPEYEKFYYEALNMTILFDKNSNQYILSNENGNKQIFEIPTIIKEGTHMVYGELLTRLDVKLNSTTIRIYYTRRDSSEFSAVTEDLIVIGHALGNTELYVCTTNGTQDQIWRFDYTEDFTGAEEIRLIWTGKLGWETTDKLKVRYNYENNSVAKLYIIDGRSQLRSINVANSLIDPSDPLHPLNFSIKSFDSCPEVWLPQAVITNGSKVGKFVKGQVQYTYSLFNRNGNITKVAPFSSLATISKSGKGFLNTEHGNSSFTINISGLDTSFTSIRIFRIHHLSSGSTTVRELYNGSHSGSFVMTDTGGNFGVTSLTLSELLNIGSDFFIPKSFEILNNYLFLGNIQEEEIDLSAYDTRAYRYRRNVTAPYTTCAIYNEAGTQEKNFSGSTYPNLSTELEFDCLNLSDYNYSGDGGMGGLSNEFYFKNSSTLVNTGDVTPIGATGPNIDISFERIPINTFTSYDGANYKYRHYKSNEVYRFGVRFITKRNSYSDVKWIIDLRMPSYSVYDHVSFHSEYSLELCSDGGEISVVVPKFTLNNLDLLPDNVEAFQIVRCVRGESGKNIIDQGLVNPMLYNPSNSVTPIQSRSYTPYPALFYDSIDQGLNYVHKLARAIIYYDGSGTLPTTGNLYFGTGIATIIPNSSTGDNVSGNMAINVTLNLNQLEDEVIISDGNGWSATVFSVEKIDVFSGIDYLTKFETFQIYCPRHLILGDKILLEATTAQLSTITGGNKSFTYYKLGSNYSIEDQTNKIKIEALGFSNIRLAYSAEGTYGETPVGADDLWWIPSEGVDSMSKLVVNFSSYLVTPFYSVISTAFNYPYLPLGKKYAISDSYPDHTKEISAIGRSFTNLFMLYNNVGDATKNLFGIGCDTIVISHSSGDTMQNFFSTTLPSIQIGYSDGLVLVDLIKVNTTQYGGRSYAARKSSEYIPCGDVTRISDSNTCYVANGDTFISQFNFHRIIPTGWSTSVTYTLDTLGLNSASNVNLIYGEFVRIYQETDLNLELREDKMLEYLDELEFNPDSDRRAYTYDQINNREDIVIKYRAQSDFVNEIVDFKTVIRYSKLKFYNEPYDSFLDFDINNFKECPSNLGEITNITSLNNLLYIHQSNGIGYWLIDPTAISNSSSGSIVLGSGDVLHKYNILDDRNGTTHFNSVIKGERGIYSFDTNTKRFLRISGGKEPAISDTKGLYKFLINRYPNSNDVLEVNLGFDPQNFTVYCSILDVNDITNSVTFSYNEFSESFVSFHDYIASIYFSDRERFYSVSNIISYPLLTNFVWVHNYSQNTNIYGEDKDWYITYISGKEGLTNKLFSSFEYKLEVIDSLGTYVERSSNFNSYQVWVENQDTGVILLNDPRTVTNYNNKWRVIIKRDINSRYAKGRLNNAYIYLKLIGNDSTDKKYKLYPLTINYEHLIY